MKTHRLPVVAALGAGAGRDPFATCVVDDVLAISRPARFRVDTRVDVLEDGFGSRGRGVNLGRILHLA